MLSWYWAMVENNNLKIFMPQFSNPGKKSSADSLLDRISQDWLIFCCFRFFFFSSIFQSEPIGLKLNATYNSMSNKSEMRSKNVQIYSQWMKWIRFEHDSFEWDRGDRDWLADVWFRLWNMNFSHHKLNSCKCCLLSVRISYLWVFSYRLIRSVLRFLTIVHSIIWI